VSALGTPAAREVRTRLVNVKPVVDGSAGLAGAELAAVLEQLPNGVVIVDRHGQPTLSNAAARRILARTESRAASLVELALEAGMRDARTGHPVERAATPVARALRGETVSAEEYFFGAPGQPEERLRVRVSSVPLREPNGTVRGAVSMFTDIGNERQQASRIARLFEAEQRARAETEQALAKLEQELAERRRAEEALHNSDQRLRLVLEASHMGTWEYDVAQDRLEWSREMASVLGEPVESLSGPMSHALSYVHPEEVGLVQQALRTTLESGQNLKLEFRVIHRGTGRTHWLLVRGRPTTDADGRVVHVTGIAMDISSRKEAEAARQTLAQGERLRALGQMASGIAHDLNQSLALITGYSDMARQELSLDVPNVGRVREMVEITARAALEGGQALKGLLSFVRTQELMDEVEVFDLADVVRDAARLTAPRWRDATQAEGRPIEVRVETTRDCIVHGSPAAIREAITNLIFNAVDALPRGGSIFLRAKRVDEQQAVAEVADTGTGIPAELQARIFDPFFTTKGERGTGLGLPQVVAIVERHGGSVKLDSQPGRGTTFRLQFPIAAEAPSSAGAAQEHPPTAAASRCVHILVVEDEEQLARMAGLVLTQRGHHVVVAASVEDALEHLHRERFELVVSDLGLGSGKNGWDLAEEVRQHWPGTRFVLVTGWGAAIDPKEAEARGVHEVIAKPYRIADLRQIADRVATEPGSAKP
jgi:PAS domain S-box-containing protein